MDEEDNNFPGELTISCTISRDKLGELMEATISGLQCVERITTAFANGTLTPTYEVMASG